MVAPQASPADYPHVTVHRTRLAHYPAVTDGRETIWLDDRLTQAEESAALLHELVHIEEGHRGHQCAAVEARVRAKVSRTMVPLEQLLRVRDWQGSLYELAEDLGVPLYVLEDRLHCLTEGERAVLTGSTTARASPERDETVPHGCAEDDGGPPGMTPRDGRSIPPISTENP